MTPELPSPCCHLLTARLYGAEKSMPRTAKMGQLTRVFIANDSARCDSKYALLQHLDGQLMSDTI